MPYDFDRLIDRRDSDSVKWRRFGPDVLPFWVADMDFVSPEPVLRALEERVAHGVLGYGVEPPELREILVERLARLYHWHVAPEAIIFVPGVVTGFNYVLTALTRPGDGLLIQTPVYPPILGAAEVHALLYQEHELTRCPDGQYGIDLAAFEASITAETRLFLLCNPHNPVGRAFTPAELAGMAEICLRHDLLICSDEIHCDLLFPGQRHVPIASLAPEIASRTVTLMAPSKTYNIAGLSCSIAIIEDPELRQRFNAHREELIGGVNILGLIAALAAYRDGGPWLEEVLAYLTANRDMVVDYVRQRMPGITIGVPEATYLAWLDCRSAGIPGNPFKFFLKEAKVVLSDGRIFGQAGEGFLRLNFGCPRSLLEAGLAAMADALARQTTGATAD
jgi:cysteine-S-conjugate beta-lyase